MRPCRRAIFPHKHRTSRKAGASIQGKFPPVKYGISTGVGNQTFLKVDGSLCKLLVLQEFAQTLMHYR
jgi:hypothetical protein